MTMILLDVLKIADFPKAALYPEFKTNLATINDYEGAAYRHLSGGDEHLYSVTLLNEGIINPDKELMEVAPEMMARILKDLADMKNICDEHDCSFFRFITP